MVFSAPKLQFNEHSTFSFSLFAFVDTFWLDIKFFVLELGVLGF